MAKVDKNVKSFLKKQLVAVIQKKKPAINVDFLKNNIIKNINETPEIFKSKPITTNLKEDNEIFTKNLIEHFNALNFEFKMTQNLNK